MTTLCSGWPSSMTDFSVSVAVGQACTQAPHDTHSESRNDSFWLAATFEAKPRPWIVSANVPCISSQARTQREQTMHFDGSNVKYGLLVVLRRVEVVRAVVAVAHLAQTDGAAMSCSSQWPLAGQVRQSSG